MQQIYKSVLIALQNIRANPLHTFLSTLGIVIGVAALVAILALGDGLEQTGRKQIESTTSLQMVNVHSKEWEIKDNIRIPLDTVLAITFADKAGLEDQLGTQAIVEIVDQGGVTASYQDSVTAAILYGNTENGKAFNSKEIMGRFFNAGEVQNGEQVAFVSGSIAAKWKASGGELVGEEIEIHNEIFKVVGVTADTEGRPVISIPYTVFTRLKPDKAFPEIIIKAGDIENVPVIKAEAVKWFDERHPDYPGYFTVSTNKGRVEQFSKGILAFKLVMGAITGISVLVGGIGIMNVLLISVTERTKEIGIRKATGAQKRDIILQFMSESVTISMVGCMFGWILGLLAVFTFVPIVNHIVDIGFTAAVSMSSVVVVLVIALLVGLVFGTYPAWRAAQLTPVDAIRHE